MWLNARRLIGRGADDLILLAIEDITERKTEERQGRELHPPARPRAAKPLDGDHGVRPAHAGAQGQCRGGARRHQAQARQLSRIVDDLLDGASQGAGQLRLEPRRMDLVALARMSAQQAQLLEPRHTIRLELPEEPVDGVWDGGRLMQVFANLLGNAVKYSPAGSEIVVRVENLGTMAQVSVQDRGLGIAPDEIPHLFDRALSSGRHHATRRWSRPGAPRRQAARGSARRLDRRRVRARCGKHLSSHAPPRTRMRRCS